MFKRLIVATFVLACSIIPSESSAQTLGYTNYSRLGTGFGCASAPKDASGSWGIKSLTAKYTQGGGAPQNASISYATNSTASMTRHRWQAYNVPGNSTVTVTLVWKWSGVPGTEITRTISYYLPSNYSTTGSYSIYGCW